MKYSLSLLSLAIASLASAQSVDTPDLSLVKKMLPQGTEITGVMESQIPGLYQVQIGGQILYISKDGKVGITGDLINLETRESLTDKSLSKWRKAQMDTIKDADKIVYKADDEKHVVDVFTDITCGYCVKLHEQIKDYNKAGITIRYLAFPRGGLTSDVATNMQKIWCAKEKQEAMSAAKLNRKLPQDDKCDNNSVTEQYTLGVDLGINGTPAMFFSDGSMQPGYLPPAQLKQKLDAQFGG